MTDNFVISFGLDIVIAILLIVAIIYAVRLTGYLKRFRDSRGELEQVIKQLSNQIQKADHATTGLNEAVDMSAHELTDRMDRARKMLDELELVIQSGDSLGKRLEDLAVRNRKIVEGGESDLADLIKQTQDRKHPASNEDLSETKKKKMVKEDTKPVMSAFSIRDPEMERGGGMSDEGFNLDDDEMLSEAERDLYKTLQTVRNTRGKKT